MGSGLGMESGMGMGWGSSPGRGWDLGLQEQDQRWAGTESLLGVQERICAVWGGIRAVHG